MKHIFTLSLVLVILLTAFAACDRGGEASSAPVYTVDENGWKKAFTGENYINVTLTSYWDDNDKTDAEIVKMDEKSGLVYSTGSSGGADSNGNSHHTEYEYYFYEKNGESYLRTKATTTEQPSGQVTVKWTDEKNDYGDVFASQLGQIINSLEWSLDDETLALSENYSLFTYDETTGAYRGKITETVERPEGYDDLIYSYDITIRFENGKIMEMKYYCVFENENETSVLHSYYFTDYGTTVIELPEMPKE